MIAFGHISRISKQHKWKDRGVENPSDGEILQLAKQPKPAAPDRR